MICQQCKKEGRESKVHCDYTTSTLLGWSPYFDEEGNLHVHDPNKKADGYRCSNGHYWAESYLKKCPNCDYGNEKLEEKK